MSNPLVGVLGTERVPAGLVFAMGLRCDRCGAEVWLGAGIRVTDLTAIIKTFETKHGKCEQGSLVDSR